MDNNKKETIINDVKITQHGNITHFTPIHKPKKEQEEIKEVGFFDKVCCWFDNLNIKPYFKFRDIANPFNDRDDCDVGSDGKTCAEIGIQIKF